MAAAAKCDVTQKSEVEQLVAWTVQTYGSLDIMVRPAILNCGSYDLQP